MILTKPEFYDEFQCIADKCPKSCCVGWQIMIDDDSLESYEKLEGPIGNRVRNSIDYEEGSFLQCDGRCEMLDDDNLCAIHREAGEDYLSYTCTMYPRHIEEYEDVREYSLSLSCPAAAEIMLRQKDRLIFIEEENDESDDLDEYEDFDYLLYESLVTARERMYDVVCDRSQSVVDRMNAMLGYAKDLQECIDDNEIFAMEDCKSSIKKDMQLDLSEEKNVFSILFSLEMLESDWPDTLNHAYDEILTKEGLVQAEAYMEEHAVEAEQLLIFFIYTYMCGAVYDDMLYSKVALAVYSVRFIFYISQLATHNLTKAAYLYAREVEHSDINIERLEDFFMDRM